jgi:hypothetical protein
MKKISFLFLLFLFLSCPAIITAQVQIESGSFGANTNTKGYTLDKNTGERTVLVEINFSKPFNIKPQVLLSVTNCDLDAKTNVRYSVEATSISRDGFVVKISSWSDTKIYSIGGTWLAYAE